jgi:hypothetical protein
MRSYARGDDERVNFYLITSTVAICQIHPTQGKTRLFRRGVNMARAATLLKNHRVHTGREYKRKASEPMREYFGAHA